MHLIINIFKFNFVKTYFSFDIQIDIWCIYIISVIITRQFIYVMNYNLFVMKDTDDLQPEWF